MDIFMCGWMVCLQFVDQVLIYTRGGAGGQGSLKLGGMGGDGGEVEVLCKEGASLSNLARLPSRRFVGEPGEDSTSRHVHGKKGASVLIKVPPGTVIMQPVNRTQVQELSI